MNESNGEISVLPMAPVSRLGGAGERAHIGREGVPACAAPGRRLDENLAHGSALDGVAEPALALSNTNEPSRLHRTVLLLSPKQLGDVLFEKLQLPGGKKGKTGAYGTDASFLEHWRRCIRCRRRSSNGAS